MQVRTWLWLWLAIVIGGFLTACASIQQPTTSEMIAQIQQAEAQVKDYHALVETVLTAPGSAERAFVQEIWQKGPDLLRTEVKEGPVEMVGQVTVYNGQQVWFFDPLHNQVHLLPVEAPFHLAGRELGTVMWSAAEELLEQSTANYVGEETVAGQITHRIQLIARPGTDLFAALGEKPVSVWIDQKHNRRLKMEMPLPAGTRYTMQVRTIEYNVDPPDSLFQFTSPPGARIFAEEEVTKPPAMHQMDLEKAQETTGFPLLVPIYLPAGLSFAQARVIEGGGSVTLIYDGDEGSLSITEGQSSGTELPDIGQEVSLRGTLGRLRQLGDRSLSLSWTEGDLVIHVSGTLPPEEMLDIARSLE